jgi:hypothetical protein
MGDVTRISTRSSTPLSYERLATPKDRKSALDRQGDERKLTETTRPSVRSNNEAPQRKKTYDLSAEIEWLESRMQQIDGELRELRSGLLNDEKRDGIEKLKMEKRKSGKKLRKLQRELYSRGN